MSAVSPINDVYIPKDSICFKCNKTFDVNTKVYLFACNHLIHKNCYENDKNESRFNIHKYSCIKYFLAPTLDPLFKDTRKFFRVALSTASFSFMFQMTTKIFSYTYAAYLKSQCHSGNYGEGCYISAHKYSVNFTHQSVFDDAKFSVFVGLLITQTGEFIIRSLTDVYNIYQEFDAPKDTPFKLAFIKNRDEQGVLVRNLYVQVIEQGKDS